MAFLLKNRKNKIKTFYSPTFQDSQQEIIAILHGYIKKKYVICIINNVDVVLKTFQNSNY